VTHGRLPNTQMEPTRHWSLLARGSFGTLGGQNQPRLGQSEAMRTYPIKDDAGVLFAFEINAQLLGGRLARVLCQVEGVADVRRRRWWVGSPDVHIRFLYRGQE